jgi:hypothetical protein
MTITLLWESVMSRFAIVLTHILAVFVLAGCGVFSVSPDASDETVMLTVDRDTYHPGDTTRVVLSNQTDTPVLYNLCFSDLERSAGDGWSYVIGPIPPLDVEASRSVACQAVAKTLAPDRTARLNFPLPDTLSEGTYRITTDVEGAADEDASSQESDGQRMLATEPFTVEMR